MPKFYKLTYGVVHDDDDHDPELIAEILNEALAVVAPSDLALSYNVYMVPLKVEVSHWHWAEQYAYEVFALLKCVEPDCISTLLTAQLASVLKERNLYNSFGGGTIREVCQQDYDKWTTMHRQEQA